uniref:Lsm14-like N-terminal domain-containing protein n=1 Tax=Vombatus ursinus TaxID=29139 RepID=A0A4X2KVF3_VOMUR
MHSLLGTLTRKIIICKVQVYFEGNMYTINTHISPLYTSFTEVKSFGKEDHAICMPTLPREKMYDHIIFWGSDIKDTFICEPPKAQPLPPPNNVILQICALQHLSRNATSLLPTYYLASCIQYL